MGIISTDGTATCETWEMSNYAPLPASGHRAAWTTWDDAHDAVVDLAWENEGWTANCQLSSERSQVVIRLSASWMVQQVIVFRDLSEPDLWLATDGHGPSAQGLVVPLLDRRKERVHVDVQDPPGRHGRRRASVVQEL